jgi:hypothetical protein
MYNKLPLKKWYLIIDDDTYLLRPSLQLLLSHLDPTVPQYIGNAVGDFKGRFAHGGSAIILSQKAMEKLWENPEVLAASMKKSLTDKWGDRLVATTFQKIGIYLDERFSHLFNGERPRTTKLRPDRMCSPLVSFHTVNTPQEMKQVGVAFGDKKAPVLWSDIWGIYRAPEIQSFKETPIRAQQDHVGKLDEATTSISGVDSAERCMQKCIRKGKSCLAWTWETRPKVCHLSPWAIVGEKAEGKYSGINAKWMEYYMRNCR